MVGGKAGRWDFLQVAGAGRALQPAGVLGCGAPVLVLNLLCPSPTSQGQGREEVGCRSGCSPLPSRQQLPSALCTEPPWTDGPDVCSASTFWAGALLRNRIPREAAVPAAEPSTSAGGDAATGEPLDEGRPMREITQKAAARPHERHPPTSQGNLQSGEKGVKTRRKSSASAV